MAGTRSKLLGVHTVHTSCRTAEAGMVYATGCLGHSLRGLRVQLWRATSRTSEGQQSAEEAHAQKQHINSEAVAQGR